MPPAPPGMDAAVGMRAYGTGFAGTGGRIKARREDFAVREELGPGAPDLGRPGGYAVYLLRKDGVDTEHALREVARRTGARLRALGLKDARAVTEQYVCSAARGRRAPDFDSPGVSLRHVGYAERPLGGGDMAGNAFDVRVEGSDGRLGEFGGAGCVPNYFGHQRFGGRRPVSHLVGRAIMAADYEEAARLLVYEDSPLDDPARREARRRIAEAPGHAAALREIPRGMDTERAVVGALASGAGHRAAVAAVPARLRRFFVQAFQSYVFNLALSRALSEGEDVSAAGPGDVCYGPGGRLGRAGAAGPGARPAVPLAGHSYYTKTRFEPHVAWALREAGAGPRDFAARGMPEAAAEGGFRTALLGCPRYEASGGRARFSLSRGCYATVLLREVIKPADPAAAGLA